MPEKQNCRHNLTESELAILQMLVCGQAYKSIAYQRGVNLRTVYAHMANVRSKLGAHSNAQAVAIAVHLRLVRV